MAAKQDVVLPILGSEVVEPVLTEAAGSSYRLLHSPGMVEGLAAGDEFVIDPQVPQGFRVTHHSGNLCVWFYCSELVEREVIEHHPLRQDVESIGGYLDGGNKGLLIFTINVSVGFSAIDLVFDKWTRQIPGSSWMYGNVYDPRDGRTPLNWWKNSLNEPQ